MVQVGLKKSCPCGSGKKYKKCCFTQKPRTTIVTMDMGEPVSVAGVSFSPSGSIILLGEKGEQLRHVSATVERSYPRVKAPKILSRIPLLETTPLSIDSNLALLQFDTIFTIDANTRTINGHMVSVAAITTHKVIQRTPTLLLALGKTRAFEFRNLDCHPDLVAIKQFLLQLSQVPNILEAGKVALVVDSHLGDLQRMSSREIPILDDFFLPDFANIVYASDVANDRFANKLLQDADKHSKALLDHIESSGWWEESQVPFSDHGHYFRIWDCSTTEGSRHPDHPQHQRE